MNVRTLFGWVAASVLSVGIAGEAQAQSKQLPQPQGPGKSSPYAQPQGPGAPGKMMPQPQGPGKMMPGGAPQMPAKNMPAAQG